jgi:nicotinamide mononucleotide transporter
MIQLPVFSKINIESSLILGAACSLILSSYCKLLPLDTTESLGFATGAVCVWLVTKGNIWNWPVGLANNIFFAILFWRARLYADFALQGVYFFMGIYGWWSWLRGGPHRSRLTVTRASSTEWALLMLLVTVGTWGLQEILIAVNGAAPFWDALTTTLCLGAQYLLCRKRIENWFFWILADIIYVPLYISRGLSMTALLYAGFLVLCITGFRRWKREIAQ